MLTTYYTFHADDRLYLSCRRQIIPFKQKTFAKFNHKSVSTYPFEVIHAFPLMFSKQTITNIVYHVIGELFTSCTSLLLQCFYSKINMIILIMKMRSDQCTLNDESTWIYSWENLHVHFSERCMWFAVWSRSTVFTYYFHNIK